MTKRTSLFLNSTATAALVMALGAPTAFAQATVDTAVGIQSIAVSATYQATVNQLLNAVPAATTTNNNINIDLTRDDAVNDTVTLAAPQTNGVISASASGNISTTAAVLTFAPSTAGDTAAVGTLQAVEANVTASSTNDTHSILVDNQGSGVRTLTGTAILDNNDTNANATGNNGTSTITVATGLDVTGPTGTATVAIDSTLAAGVDNDATGDLIVSSTQEVEVAAVSGTVDGATTGAGIESLDGATVSVLNNDQGSSATANTATNSISSLDTTASITGSTAVANLQVIIPASSVTATTSNSEIVVFAGDDRNDNGDASAVDNSTVLISDNSQSARATGSASTQSITLDASSITGTTGVASSANPAGVLTATGDSVVANVQNIETGVTVAANTLGNIITSNMQPDDGDAQVLASTLEIDGNTQSASATGVTTSNTLSLTSGATMSAQAVVASAQVNNGSVTGLTNNNTITNEVGDDLTSSSMLTSNNVVSARATGSSATNALGTSSGTNNLSAPSNNGGTTNTATSAFAATAGLVVTNDQSTGSATFVEASNTANQVLAYVDDDVLDSTVVTDGNTLSSSATGNTAGNEISLAFNALTGTISGLGTGAVAIVANEQTLASGAEINSITVGANGAPIVTNVESDVSGSGVSTSGNTVSAAANGNVTTANNVTVDATNITSGTQAGPQILSDDELTATGSFIAASTQTSSANVTATQLNNPVPASATLSNTIFTNVGDDIENSSSVASDNNVLSAVATANSANNAVALGTSDTATIAASGAVANYQGTTGGSVNAYIGLESTDPIPPYVSLNSGGSSVGQLNIVGNSLENNGGGPLLLSFNSPLTTEEVGILVAAGYTNATVGGTTAELAPGNSADFTIFNTVVNIGGGGLNTGDESFTITGFTSSGAGGTRSGAGVLVVIDADGGSAGGIYDSTVSVSGNTAVGEVTGNNANNAASATATTITGLSAQAATTSVGVSNGLSPVASDLSIANKQDSATTLQTEVYAVFGIVDNADDIDAVQNSTQIVSDNLQQAYATANRATNSVDLTATNTNADTSLASIQNSDDTVTTTSEIEVVANAGGSNSSLTMDGNRNQSVANGNVVTNATTLDVTNATAIATNATASRNTGSVVANNVVATSQFLNSAVSASAETDVYNQDVTRPDGNDIVNSDVSLSDNSTIAQATGNTAVENSMSLGNAGTANMGSTGVLGNAQLVFAAGAVSANVDQDVSVTLANTATVPMQSSSVSLDGNSATASARSNVATNALNVDGANIASGAGGNATFSESTGDIEAAYILGSTQANAGAVTATTNQARVEVVMSNQDGDAINASTVSVSNNASSASATANTAVNSVSVGANAANVDAATMLVNGQRNDGVVAATGGSNVSVQATANGANVSGIDGSSIMLTGNSSAASAVGNQAQNTSMISGANITSGDTGLASASTVTFADLTVSAGNVLLNSQDNFAAITSTNTANVVTINAGTTTGTGAAASGTTLGVVGNVTEARASANLALNSSISVGGASTTAVDSTGLVLNTQWNQTAGVVNASASTQTTISLTGAGAAGALDTGSATMEGNSTLALARGNVAENAVTANGANVGAGTNPATTSSASPEAGVLNASFGVFNEQVQFAAINATSADASYRVDATSGTGLALNAASAMVGGNSINATGFGNVATNSVTLVSLNGGANDASAAIFNGQINSGAVTSLATGATIGTYSFGGVSSASVGVDSNSITSTAVGNFATSTVTRASR